MFNKSKKLSINLRFHKGISKSYTIKLWLFLVLFLSIVKCKEKKSAESTPGNTPNLSAAKDSILMTCTDSLAAPPDCLLVMSDMEKIMISAGLANIKDLDSSIRVELKYSTPDNFTGIDMYGDFNECYLQKDVAEKLVHAQHLLKDSCPELSLIVYDAVRPKSIQKIMWDSARIAPALKPKYLSNPKTGSLHNYGAAVDLTIVDKSGNELDMGTGFDSFDELAQPAMEEQFLRNGRLSKQQYDNRILLRSVMKQAGFYNIETEWWHFSTCGLKTAAEKYAVIESHFLTPGAKLPSVDSTLAKIEYDISFRVQIRISRKKLAKNAPLFKGLDVWEYYHKGYYKYTTGKFRNLQEAYKYRDSLRDEMGFLDSWVAAFNFDKRIGIRDAIEMNYVN